MSQISDLTDAPNRLLNPTGNMEGTTEPDDVPAAVRRIPRIGVWAWSFVGFVVAVIIIVTALGVRQRDPPAYDVRGRAGRVLPATGRTARTPRVQAFASLPAWSSSASWS